MNRNEFIQAFQASGEITQAALVQLTTGAGVPNKDDTAAFGLDGALMEFSRDIPLVESVSQAWAGSPVTMEYWYHKSQVLSIESPTGQHPIALLDLSVVEVDGEAGSFYLSQIANGANYKLRYTALHRIPPMPESGDSDAPVDVTIPAYLHAAYFKLAAAVLYERLAGKHAETAGSSFAADSVSYQTKSGEYSRLAKEARKAYRRMLGLPEDFQMEYAGFSVELEQPDYRSMPEAIWPTLP